MMDAQSPGNWADRLGSTKRYIFILIASLLGFFALGMVAGFSYGVFENGRLPTKPLSYIIFASMIAFAAVAAWVLATLIRSLRYQSMSRFDRRYWKMWAVIVGLSIPIGIGFAAIGLSDQGNGFSLMLSNAPITPQTAILSSVVLAVLLTLAAVYYFRAIDDHEERAYLWGSTIAFHFLAIVFPLYWLLARGGIVPALTIGITLLLVLLSIVVQAIVWALFKFR